VLKVRLVQVVQVELQELRVQVEQVEVLVQVERPEQVV